MSYQQPPTSEVYLSADESIPPDVASSIYAFVDRPSRSIILRNRALAKVEVVGGYANLSGLPIYLHKRTPCTYATIAGIVVGVTEKDRRWEIMVDDGTQIIDVTIHSKSIPDKLIQHGAIKASTSRHTLDVGQDLPVLALEPGDLVKVTGKIWRRQWTTPRGKTTFKVGLDLHTLDVLNQDPTEEARHNLLAHQMDMTEYDRTFSMPREHVSIVRIVLPLQPFVSVTNRCQGEAERMERKFSDDLRALVRSRPDHSAKDENGFQQPLPFSHGQNYGKRPRRYEIKRARSEEVVSEETPSRRASQQRVVKVEIEAGEPDQMMVLLPSATFDAVQTPSKKKIKSEPETRVYSLESNQPPTAVPELPLVNLDQATTRFIEPQRTTVFNTSQSRQLRTPSKLKESQCTFDLFRLHIQKFLVDHDRFNTRCQEIQMDVENRNVSVLRGRYPPPRFNIQYLMSVRTLSELAERVVGVMVRSRERDYARRGLAPPASGEVIGEKVRRLFERCIRQLVNEGYIVLASSDVPSQSTDGRLLPAILSVPDMAEDVWNSSQHSLPRRLEYEVTKWKEQFTPSRFSPNSGNQPISLSMEGSGDTYQLLTPALLSSTLEVILRRNLPSSRSSSSFSFSSSYSNFNFTHFGRHAQKASSSTSSSTTPTTPTTPTTTTTIMGNEEIQRLTHLLRRDDRWRFVSEESVQDTLVEMMMQNGPGGQMR